MIPGEGLIPSSDEVRKLIERHKLSRPDPCICKHPQASRAMYASWVKWCDDHEQLKTLLERALQQENSGWKDVTGQVVEQPINWTEGKGSFTNLRSGQPSRTKSRAQRRNGSDIGADR